MNGPWPNRNLYPFQSKYHDLPIGRMHYADQGHSDQAVVMVHGNPAWSFTYRSLIACLADRYRCIAPDLIGFGLSDKPANWDYLPEQHADNLERFLNHLDLPSITLVVGDWGGPIGLSYALKYPERIKSLIITNSWMWSVEGDFHYEMFSRFMGGLVGRFLIRRYNFFVKVLMKRMFRARISTSVHEQYIQALARPEERKGCWVFPREIIGSSHWLATLWDRRAAIADKPALILWGNRDIAFRKIEMERWKTVFSDCEVHAFDQAGHFVLEDVGEEVCPLVRRHLQRVWG